MKKKVSVLYDLLEFVSETYPDKISFRKRAATGEFPGISFSDLRRFVDQLTAGWIEEGLSFGDRVGYFCDSTPNWLKTDLSILTAGGVVVPRGTDIVEDEILYILNHSEARFLVVQKEKDRARIQRIQSNLPKLEKIYVLETDTGELAIGEGTVSGLASKGKDASESKPGLVRERVSGLDPDALATLIYTSGTTGNPKGVMLSQKGWITAIHNTSLRLDMNANDNAVSLLPPWHAFERAIEYAVISHGIDFLVSNMTNLKDDLRDFRPTIFPSVPRIWESVYNGIMVKVAKEGGFKEKLFQFFLKVGGSFAKHKSVVFGYDFALERKFFLSDILQRAYSFFVLLLLSPLKLLSVKIFSAIHKALGGRIRICISAGSALPSVVDGFLSAIGLKVLEGYGMTETSAVVSIRSNTKPTKGTVGIPIDGYQIKLKDEHGRELKEIAAKGTLWIKSDQILKGYYKRPELNEVAFDKDGFFDTGDLMQISYRNELVFSGRSKDTIALIGGENIEPIPIEDKLLSSPYIDQVMVVGHDRKTLGALIVPNFEAVGKKLEGLIGSYDTWDSNPKIRELFRSEITAIISKHNGFKAFEVVPANNFYIVPRPFDPDREMTRTLKMKRNVIAEVFAKEVGRIYQ
ncbi:AMP-dependent synthetase/ligase [Leptospira ilyithenensis]|uniref:Long-chain fatty acid--CoA ligase n=1 Tax=Leptospira ilyithenensis TaxID=2484901 RepID=A0A4R9LLY6_9LEPT|nr:AMP-binding protein [Leptospira ilyithenensis]TGN09140.1 long-chain fatty acid--CoA ligase [Leptospira ilyithenensis]